MEMYHVCWLHYFLVENFQVVSGLGREIPSPNGSAIRGAIQTDAAINSGIFSGHCYWQ